MVQRRSRIANQSGQSIVQVLVGVSIMVVTMMAFMSMQASQSRENRAIAEKLAANDLQQFLITAVSGSATCDAIIASLPSSSRTFDPKELRQGKSPDPIDLGKEITAGSTPHSPSIAKVGEAASAVAPSTVVQAIQLANIRCPGCANPSASSQFVADLQVTFDQNKLVRSLRPASVQISLQTSDVGAMKKIESCGGSQGEGPLGILLTSGTSWTSPSEIDPRRKYKITIIGGGGGGGGNGSYNGIYGAGGGGAGATTVWYVSGLQPNTTYPITIGAGGTAGTNAGGSGGDGGTTSIQISGATLSAAGGKGGKGQTKTQTTVLGGSGGVADVNASVHINGQPGSSGGGYSSGAGGSTALGQGGPSANFWNYDRYDGINGMGYGAGGGGSAGGSTGTGVGGTGSQGAILIE